MTFVIVSYCNATWLLSSYNEDNFQSNHLWNFQSICSVFSSSRPPSYYNKRLWCCRFRLMNFFSVGQGLPNYVSSYPMQSPFGERKVKDLCCSPSSEWLENQIIHWDSCNFLILYGPLSLSLSFSLLVHSNIIHFCHKRLTVTICGQLVTHSLTHSDYGLDHS